VAFLIAALFLRAQAGQPLLVISVDGLDQRYLRDCDRLGLKIPHLRQLIREGQWSEGVVGVVPTITWPSHTTILSGVDPSMHGIRSNRLPAEEGGDYPWSVKLLKARTLLDAAHDAGLKAATVTWPVTVDAPVQFNLPEYFQRRRGGSMDTRSIESRSTPRDLVTRIAAMFPSFRQEWMDDRTRTQAVVFLLKTEKPDLLLVHLVDLDSEEHDNAPFSSEANAILEYTDELVGQMMDALPKGSLLALVSDHGFEKVDAEVNLDALSAKTGVAGVRPLGGLVLADTPKASAFLRQTSEDAQYGIGRAIPREELMRYAPQFANADSAFEAAPGFMFAGGATGEIVAKPREIGNHGHWPARYRSVYVMWGPGISARRLPEMSLKDIAGRLASVLGIPFTPGPK
jgi:predicted AlkP superfamily pyrophosphatase or phosphodiesterase